MPFGDYNELVSTLGNWLARDDLAEDIPDFIWLAETEAQRVLGMRTQEKTVPGTMVAGQKYIELPDDFLEGRYLRIETDPPRDITIQAPSTFRSVDAAATLEQHPLTGYVSGSRLHLTPVGAADAYTLTYIAGLVHLGPKTKTNYLLQTHPDFLLYGALKHSAPFLGQDARLPMWQSLYADARTQASQQEWRARTGGGPLHMRSDRGHP